MDADLNFSYKLIKARLIGGEATAIVLVAAQKHWIQFRDSEGEFSSSAAAQGIVYPMIYSMCLDDLTKVQTEQFKAYLNCQVGDLACPVLGSN